MRDKLDETELTLESSQLPRSLPLRRAILSFLSKFDEMGATFRKEPLRATRDPFWSLTTGATGVHCLEEPLGGLWNRL